MSFSERNAGTRGGYGTEKAAGGRRPSHGSLANAFLRRLARARWGDRGRRLRGLGRDVDAREDGRSLHVVEEARVDLLDAIPADELRITQGLLAGIAVRVVEERLLYLRGGIGRQGRAEGDPVVRDRS